MFDPRYNNNGGYGGGFGGGRRGGSAYQFQQMAYPVSAAETGGPISKVMALLAASFLVAVIGAFVGVQIAATISIGFGGLLIIFFGSLICLFVLQANINVPKLNLFLMFLFMFIEGLSLGPLVFYYLAAGVGFILAEALLITIATSLGLAVYSWTTKRSFSGLRDYLFFGIIILLFASIINIFIGGTMISLLISVFGVALFSGYILYYVQQAKNLSDTLPNAIGLTVQLFLAILNLFLFILRILTILQGGRRN